MPVSYVNTVLEEELRTQIGKKVTRMNDLKSKMQACGNTLEPAIRMLHNEIEDLKRSLSREKEISEYMREFCGHRRDKS